MRSNHFTRVLGFCLCFALGVSHADTSDTLTPPFTDVHTIAAAGAPVPVEHDFSITATGAYQIILTDLGAQQTPAVPLTKLTMAVTTGSTLVGQAQVGAGVFTFNVAAGATGTYTVHVVGTPGSAGSGDVGLQIGTAANPTSLGVYSDNIGPPANAVPSGTAILDDSFTVDNSGSYVISLSDLNLPQGLATLELALTAVAQQSPDPLLRLPDPNNNGAMQGTISLSSGTTYRITAIAVAGTANAGLFGAVVTPVGGTAPAYGKAVPVGATTLVGTPTLAAGSHTVTLTDLGFPASLTQLEAAVMLNGQTATAAPLSTAGTQSFTAAAGTYQVFTVAVPQTTTPAAGAYSLQIQPTGGAAELSLARAVIGTGSNLAAYSFDGTLQSAGTYSVTLTDFSFPVALNSVRLAAVQNGALVGTPLTTAGTLSANAQAGPITYLAIAQADPSHGGLFDVNVTASGSSTLLFDVTQGVGAGFISRKVHVTTAGTYGISSSDIGFPASFGNLALVVTQGASNLGNIFSLGNLSLSAATGDYFINLIAQPATVAAAGTYALVMAPAPTVSLAPSASSVVSGGTVTLTWSTTNATSCTAKDGWTGSEPTSGTFQTPALTANTVFTLSCTGPGGTASQSVTITVTSAPPTSSGHGGGGAIDEMVVLGLATLLARRLWARWK